MSIEPEQVRQIGQNAPFFAMVVASIVEKREEIIRTVIASALGGVIVAAGGYALVINDLKNDVMHIKVEHSKFEREIQQNQNNINQNLLELVRQAGTDKLTLQELRQINANVQEIKKDLRDRENSYREWSNGRLRSWPKEQQ